MSAPNNDQLNQSLNHAWSWFELHCGQRMQWINFFLASSAFLVAGYATAASTSRYNVAGPIAGAGLAVSVIFNLLDLRTRELIRAAEHVIDEIESHLEAGVGASIRLVLLTSKGSRKAPSYRNLVNALTLLGVVGFGSGLVHALAS